MSRAQAEICALEVALESYKIDNGDYPRDTNSTDKIDATKAPNLSTKYGYAPDLGAAASLVLYKALSGDTDCNRTLSATEKAANRVYFNFKPTMLYPYTAEATDNYGTPAVEAIMDPFLNVYGYSTIGSTTTKTGTLAGGYNPTFDLWSTADPTQSGSTPSAGWITNW
jgi:hypothetical protein